MVVVHTRFILIQFFAVLVAGTLFLSSCGKPGKADDGFRVSGKVAKPVANGTIALKKLNAGEFVLVDSVKPDAEGNYEIIGKVPHEEFMLLDFFGKQRVLFVGDNKEITVNADGDRQDGAKQIKGTQDNDNLQRVMALEQRMAIELQPMQQELQLAAQNRDEMRMNQYIDYMKRANGYFRSRFKKMIDTTGVSIVSLYATHNLDPDEDFGFLDSLGQQFKAKRPDVQWTQEFLGMLDKRRPTALGQVAPAFSLPTPDGKRLGVADFKGKVLVVDFWASWCGPCRRNNPFMVDLYSRYKGKGVEFLGVSLDKEREPWLAAIQKDKLTWPHVSDLKWWDCEAAKLYGLDQVPYVVVIGRDGRIAAKKIDGAELEKKLKELTTTL